MFHARLIQYKLGTGKRQTAENLTKKFDEVNRGLSGFRGNVYLFDDQNGEYQVINYWDTKADAENAQSFLFPQLENELNGITQEKPTYKFFEVYDPFESGDLVSKTRS
ncbi:hypothetical protein [Peribacillus deserti]|uniref:ABM domain-containing protein n=1 Tax=Peribacillus deserti TaxID=673318 RepID=A0A2N5M8Q7_9BACI|nr:hypothetical protein [Peribacillus deserti]PLT30739.1 hypothetical protein CUU66_06180 [Peribacillus deserti]